MLAMSGYAKTLVEQYKFRIFCLLVQMVTRCKSWWIPNNTVFAIWEFCDVNGYTSQTLWGNKNMSWLCINVTKKDKFWPIIGVKNIIITDSIDLINTFMFQNFAGHVFALPGQQYHIVRFSITISSMVSTCCVIIWHYTLYSAITG